MSWRHFEDLSQKDEGLDNLERTHTFVYPESHLLNRTRQGILGYFFTSEIWDRPERDLRQLWAEPIREIYNFYLGFVQKQPVWHHEETRGGGEPVDQHPGRGGGNLVWANQRGWCAVQGELWTSTKRLFSKRKLYISNIKALTLIFTSFLRWSQELQRMERGFG